MKREVERESKKKKLLFPFVLLLSHSQEAGCKLY